MPKPQTHAVRIIAGKYRRRLLPVPTVAGLRPTPDRVRQTVFNWLDHLLGDWTNLRVLDAFAGTGSLGLEAASRGAASVVLCEHNGEAARSLRTTVQTLGATECTVIHGDAQHTLAQTPVASIDLLLLDPPFHAGWIEKIQALAAQKIAPNGLVYVESECALTWAGFTVLRHLKAGAVHAQVLQKIEE